MVTFSAHHVAHIMLLEIPLDCDITPYMVLAHLSKSNSRTFQGLSRTIRRIYTEN